MANKISVFVVMAACISASNNFCDVSDFKNVDLADPTVESSWGSFRGCWMTSRRGRLFQAYRGIRYAQSPTGPLRFLPPQPIYGYDSEVRATTDGPSCPQPIRNKAGYHMSEDCLRLNVYTPRSKRLYPLPVLVYIHSGGFYSLSGRSDVAGPRYLLDRDLVLVTINYRLGSLGFLSTGDEYAPGNNGFKDQVVALKWVQRNIAAFGGDPDLVTIAGYGAGSMSVMLHMVSPMSAGLFHGAVLMSGSPISQMEEVTHQRHLAERQAALVGCPTDSSRVILDCLRKKRWREIANSLDEFFEFGSDPYLLWSHVIEPDFGQERFLPFSPLAAAREGLLSAVPCIVSQTTGEFYWKAFGVLIDENLSKTMDKEWDRIAPISFLLPKEASSRRARRLRQEYLEGKALVVNDSSAADGLGMLYGDALVGFGVHRMANLLCRQSSRKVWYSEFAYVGRRSLYEGPYTFDPVQAAHHDDLIYIFSMPAMLPDTPPSRSKDSLTIDRMTAILYNFARHGDPNPPPFSRQKELAGLHWPALRPQEREYLHVADQLAVRAYLFEDRFHTWDQLYPIYYAT